MVIALGAARAQVPQADANPAQAVLDRMDKDGCTVLESGVKVCRYDYLAGEKKVEAISFVPAGKAPFPGVLMIPGFERTARDIAPLGIRLAREGFAGVAVTQPGFGKSEGPPDFVGPKTLAVLIAGYEKLKHEKYADPNRMAIYGYSRGGMAASLLATQLSDLKAAVFGAGIYDFQRAYDETPLVGARKNMMAETGMTKEAVRERSSILRMDQLKCPVLVLHGELDDRVPVSQAKLLRDKLTQLHKEFEIKIFPDKQHSVGPEGTELTVDFFRRKLQQASSSRN
ncbi:MAG TPA: prolyl oligopeptidase family serine peptidase [Candidatus Sulfotelmatobacter sp.]|nr:prolyl oligopeptidase family serine peptidase [Candidatus Sulfotelmatobacter sp.]